MIKRSIRIAAIPVAAMLLLFCQSLSFPRAAAATSPSLSDLAWMAGDWQTDANGRFVSDEHWASPAAGIMIGMSRTIAGEKLVSFEALRIEQRGDAIFYVASVKGSCPATDFKLTRVTAQEAIFENPAHDFPKRVMYRKKSAQEMTASVDGGEGTKSQQYVYRLMVRK